MKVIFTGCCIVIYLQHKRRCYMITPFCHIAAHHWHHYRPQLRCGKVMFLYLSVILSTWGMSAGIHTPRQTPPAPEQTPPWSNTPWQTAPWADTPWQAPPPGQTCSPAVTAVDGTHPTGMHSCFQNDLADKQISSSAWQNCQNIRQVLWTSHLILFFFKIFI